MVSRFECAGIINSNISQPKVSSLDVGTSSIVKPVQWPELDP